jgi:hypothetical protein
MMPFISDLNHDGSPDLIVVSTKPDNKSVETRWYKNTAAIGAGLSFNEDYELLDIELKANDTPFFTDVNDDGLNDLLIGKSTGRLEYHENQGDDSNPYFLLEDPTFLDIDDSYIEFKLNLVPFVIDIDLDGHDDLITTDYSGIMAVYLDYKNVPEKMYNIVYNKISARSDTSYFGHHTWMTGGFISGIENPFLILGNPQGGLSIYKNIADNKQDESNEVDLKIYPNPLINSNILTTRSNTNGQLLIFNNLGQLIEGPLAIRANRNLNLEIGYMPQGMYIFKVIDELGRSDEQRFIRY